MYYFMMWMMTSYFVNELRLYQTPNLMVELPVSISAPSPIESKWSATNLITNLQSRTSGNDLKPIINSSGGVASYESCYKTSDV